jgi:acetyl esterase/lipase
LPLVVWIHGGAWRAGSKTTCPLLYLTERGYIVASINYRLSQEAIFPAQIEDCKAAIRFLRANAAKYSIDADHIGVAGDSAGGHLVALLGTSNGVKDVEGKVGNHLAVSSAVQCVVDFYGPTDMMKFKGQPVWPKTDDPKSPLCQLVGGPLAEKQELVAKANPITYVSKSAPPFLIIHGNADNTVPFNQSELLVAALKQAGADVAFEVVQGGGHGFNPQQTQRLRPIVEAFFDKHLKSSQVK